MGFRSFSGATNTMRSNGVFTDVVVFMNISPPEPPTISENKYISCQFSDSYPLFGGALCQRQTQENVFQATSTSTNNVVKTVLFI